MDVSHFGWVANRDFDACLRLSLFMSELFGVFGGIFAVFIAPILVGIPSFICMITAATTVFICKCQLPELRLRF